MVDLLMAALSFAFALGGFFWGRHAFNTNKIATHWAITRTRLRAGLLFAVGGAFLPTTLGVDQLLDIGATQNNKDIVDMMLELPEVSAHLKSVPQEQHESTLQRLLREGNGMLPEDVLIERAQLQSDFLETLEDEPCKDFLNGSMTADDIARYRQKLSPTQRERWRAIKLIAVELPLTESARRTAPTQAQVTQAYLESVATLPEADRKRLTAGLSKMAQASAADACWLGVTYHKAILGAPKGAQTLLVRKLFTP